MNESYVRNVIEAALLAAASRCRPRSWRSCSTTAGDRAAEEIRAALATLAAGVRQSWHRDQGDRSRFPDPGAARAGERDLAALAGAPGQVLARAPGDPRADRLPAADHACRNRGGARRCREPQHHQDAASSVTGYASSAIGTYQDGPELLGRLAISSTTSVCVTSTSCRRWRSSRRWARSTCSSSCRGAPVSGEAAAATANAHGSGGGAGSADEPVLDDSASASSHSDADDAGEDERAVGGRRWLAGAGCRSAQPDD